MARRFSEDELIATLFAPLAGAAALGLRDDAALLPASKNPTVATTDALVAGVHFFEDDPPGLIAKKALRVNLSDLAAKGAEPVGFLLAIAMPPDWTNDWLAAFAAGLGEDALAYRCPLLGGDTVSTPGPLTLSVTALGEAPEGRFIARTTGQAGDAVFVSGTIGDAIIYWSVIFCRVPDSLWRRRCVFTSRPRWTSPTASLATSPNWRAPRNLARKSRSRACPFPTRRGKRSLSTQDCWMSR